MQVLPIDPPPFHPNNNCGINNHDCLFHNYYPHNHVSPTPPIIDSPLHPNNNCGMNNQRWNHYLCGNSGTITLLLGLFLVIVCNYTLNWWIFDQLSLNKEVKAQLIGIFNQFIACNGFPLIFYLTNDKLYQHVKNEIF